MTRFLPILLLAPGLALTALPAPAEEALPIAGITAELTEPRTVHVLVGEITAPETLQAAFPVGGRLTDVRVQVGDRVSAGDELARIEQVQQAQALASAQAQVSAAQAEYTAAKFQADRQAELFARGATTRSDRDSAADRLAAAIATKSQSEAALDQAQQALEDTVLIAPADATVTDRFGEPGQVVGAAQPVLELAIGPGFEAKFDVPETVLTSSTQDPGTVRLSAIDRPSITVSGHVSEVSPLRFVILLERLAEGPFAIHIADRVVRTMRAAFGAEPSKLVASVGVSQFPDDGESTEDLLRRAWNACEGARMGGGDLVGFCSGHVSEKAHRRLALERALIGVLERDELSLHYQPQVDVEDEALVALEPQSAAEGEVGGIPGQQGQQTPGDAASGEGGHV